MRTAASPPSQRAAVPASVRPGRRIVHAPRLVNAEAQPKCDRDAMQRETLRLRSHHRNLDTPPSVALRLGGLPR